MEDPQADAEAVARVRAGEAEAFRTLMEGHGRAVFRLAFRMTGNPHDAEDVVQETFLRAYRKLDEFEARAQFGSWLHRIAANCAYDLLRARARRQARFDSIDAAADGAQELAGHDPAPDRLVAGGEIRERVQAAMARLSNLERSAFTLRHLEGMSIAEIAQALDLEGESAKQSIFRAVRKVRAALAEHAPAKA
ncbi:MAG TPA: sigma-70 family RNA polymerase sigma factor [Vicinamibacteria bacterium]|jgi:RNA polymerase sigma-70 factor (ECF subfamily)|nr:sigma-70 family RNA polymerase sigma factor [Vicinamibacteria bacterium]